MGASWKSTVSALVSAAGMFVIFASAPPYNVHFPIWISALAGFMALGGLAGLGIVAKDSDVTGEPSHSRVSPWLQCRPWWPRRQQRRQRSRRRRLSGKKDA